VTDKEKWVKALSLDLETGLDPPGQKVRAAQGEFYLAFLRPIARWEGGELTPLCLFCGRQVSTLLLSSFR